MADSTDVLSASGPANAESRAATPSVTAVVVAHRPGSWFEETLDSLVTQDYPRLEIVIVDAAGADDPAPDGDDAGVEPSLDERVRSVAPNASIVDAGDTDGFGAAANTVLETDVDSAFLLVCHDDIRLAPDAVRVLVVEALRSNAGVVGPKLVHWNRPDRLQHVGLQVDRFAAWTDVIEPEELDQEQFDAVTDVFAVPSACMLIRTPLFAAIGGFDPGIDRRGDDVDFCWRAQLAGARVLVVPDAVAAHREELRERTGVDDVRRTRARHQLRTVLVTGGSLRLATTVPLAAALSAAEVMLALVTGRVTQARDIVSAWSWNLRRWDQVRRRRAGLSRYATASRRDIAAAQVAGSVRINAFLRGQIGRRDGAFGRELTAAIRTGTTRFSVVAWALVVFFVCFGSRSLLASGVPIVGDFAAFPETGSAMIDSWWSSWRGRDLGSVGSTPTGIGFLGVLSIGLGGAVGLVRTLWVLGPVFVGLVGAWRLLAITGSRRAQMATLAGYTVLPLPWAAIGVASWSALGAYAAAPWVLRALLEMQAAAPYRRPDGPVRPLLSAAVAAGSGLGLIGIFDPNVSAVTAVLALGLLAGALVAINPTGIARLVVGSVAISAIAGLLALPFTLDLLLNGLPWHTIAAGRGGEVTDISLADLLRFSSGRRESGPLVWAFVVPMALPLLVGRAWRLELAVRLWFVALTAWALGYAAVRGWVPFGLPSPLVLVSPAAIAVAGLCGVAVSSTEHDLRGAGFGWRQLLLPLAAVAALVVCVPSIGMLESGRWDLPRRGYEHVLPFADPALDGSYRVLWLGHPDHLPAEGVHLSGDVAWVATIDGLPDITETSLTPDRGAAGEMEHILDRIVGGETSRAGRLLGGVAVRYVVTLDRLAPAPFSGPEQAVPVPVTLTATFDTQLDLRRLPGTNSAIRVYENTEWIPVRAAAVEGFDDGIESVDDLGFTEMGSHLGVLPGAADRLEGPVPAQTELFVAQTPDPGWTFVVEGQPAARRRAMGWATSYLPVSDGGSGVLAYETPRWRQLVVLAQLLLLFGSTGFVLRRATRTTA